MVTPTDAGTVSDVHCANLDSLHSETGCRGVIATGFTGTRGRAFNSQRWFSVHMGMMYRLELSFCCYGGCREWLVVAN